VVQIASVLVIRRSVPRMSRIAIAKRAHERWIDKASRSNGRLRWKAGALKEMVDGIKSPDELLPRGFVFTNTIMALLVEGVSLFFFVLTESMRGFGRVRPRDGEDSLRSIIIVFGLAAVIGLPWVFSAIWRWIRHGTPERSIQQTGRAVLDSLVYAGEIDRRSGEFQVFADRHDQGSIFCWLSGGTGREQNTFLEAVRQILRPIDNPRYLLARPRFWRWFREDYFCVPEVLARKKEYAEFFAKRWRKTVGPIQLVFTRTPEGRVLLLRARGHSLAASFQKHSERISCWK
jgi:hypothetical protein